MAGSRSSARARPAMHLHGRPQVLIAAVLAALASACFDPAYPAGIPCSGAQTCPPGQTCDPYDLVCRAVPRPDASPAEPPDAGADQPPDAGPDIGIDASIDPCASAPCGPGTCESMPGGYTCDCDPGHEFDGTTCVDIDECAVTPDPCAPGGVCVNGEDQYTCACEDGHEFDGTTCVLVTIPITDADGTPRRFEDGTAAESCQAYRFPALPYVYEGAIGDGIYAIQPAGRAAPVDVFCDMTTDGGGWTGIDPAAAEALGGVATAVRAEGITHTCQVQASGSLAAFYRDGTGTRTQICRYDIDLGFAFDTVRVSAAQGERLELRSESVAPDTTDVSNLLASPWGENVVVGGRGDVVVGSGSRTSERPALSMGEALGLSGAATQQFAAGAAIAWPADRIAGTARDTVLRIQLSESGSQHEGYRWTGGRVYVREDGALGTTALQRP